MHAGKTVISLSQKHAPVIVRRYSRSKMLKYNLAFCSLIRNFVPEMTSIHKTNILLALVALALAVLCVLSILT